MGWYQIAVVYYTQCRVVEWNILYQDYHKPKIYILILLNLLLINQLFEFTLLNWQF